MANALSVAAVELRRRLMMPVRSQSDLARRLGVSPQAVSAWLSGAAKPEPERMAAIETLLGIPMRDWISFEQPSTESTDDGCSDSP
jgi:transcriptional regulator with XRE-family HTH domain